MKKIGNKSNIRGKNKSIPWEERNMHNNIHSSEVKDVEDTVEAAPPTIPLRHAGVKLESEGQFKDTGGLLGTVEEVVEEPWEEDMGGGGGGGDPSQACVVDLTQQFNRIFVQTMFNSFKEFEKLFKQFKTETGSVFRIKSSCSIGYENSRRKKHLIPSRFRFVTVQYCCVHYGQPKVASQGIRSKQRYLPCGCESMLSLSYNRGALVISQANMRHNHDVSSEMAPFYAINRRISNEELQEVAKVVERIPNSRSLQNFLQIHFQRPTTLQDAKNVRSRLKALKGSQTTAVPKPRVNEHQFLPAGEEGEQDILMMEHTDEGTGDYFEIEEYGKEENINKDYYAGRILHHDEVLKQKQQEKAQDHEPELDPSFRREIISRFKTRLNKTLETCGALVFMERVSIIENLILEWEKDEPQETQSIQHSIILPQMSELEDANLANTNLTKGVTSASQNYINTKADTTTTSLPAEQSLSHYQSVLPKAKRAAKYHTVSPKGSRSLANNKHQHPFTNVEVNRKQDIAEFTQSYGNAVECSRTDIQVVRGENWIESNERRPVILSIAKGRVDKYEQAVEVEIEVDGEVAMVKAVKREPLECHEVFVGNG